MVFLYRGWLWSVPVAVVASGPQSSIAKRQDDPLLAFKSRPET
ncbi:hypothetical protein ATPR_2387 [Acetobacter tropicalis NBRC 101654]|uniref:Uncharacterized protein n=1 Tax=Acetobacter tropicalis NBRC 101654 TaxID=749388 RepID=F7VG88_9PROT|nr:hypothetical protein ATPR_2387 [Acetobacter tropicalis NBRC 101654]